MPDQNNLEPELNHGSQFGLSNLPEKTHKCTEPISENENKIIASLKNKLIKPGVDELVKFIESVAEGTSGLVSQAAILEAAKICLKKHTWTALERCQSFGLTDPNSVVQFYLAAFEEKPNITGRKLGVIPVTDEQIKKEFALTLAQQRGFAPVKELGITNEDHILEIIEVLYKRGNHCAGHLKNADSVNVTLRNQLAERYSSRFPEDFILNLELFHISDIEKVKSYIREIAETSPLALAGKLRKLSFMPQSFFDDYALKLAEIAPNLFARYFSSSGIKSQDVIVAAVKLALKDPSKISASAASYMLEAIENSENKYELMLKVVNSHTKDFLKCISGFKLEGYREEQRLEIAKICSQELLAETLKHLDQFSISGQEHLKDLAISILKINCMKLAEKISDFGINDKEVVKEIGYLCAAESANCLQYIENFGYKNRSEKRKFILLASDAPGEFSQFLPLIAGFSLAERKEFALKRAALDTTSRFLSHFKNYGISERAFRKNLALMLAAKKPGEIGQICDSLRFNDEKDFQEIIFHAANNNPKAFALQLHKFKMLTEETKLDLVLICAKSAGEELCKNLQGSLEGIEEHKEAILLTALKGSEEKTGVVDELIYYQASLGNIALVTEALKFFSDVIIDRYKLLKRFVLSDSDRHFEVLSKIEENAENYSFGKYQGKRALGPVRLVDYPYAEAELEVIKNNSKDDLYYKKIWERLKVSPLWQKDRQLILLFEEGAEFYGYKSMLRYVSASDVSRHDILYSIHNLIKFTKQFLDPESYALDDGSLRITPDIAHFTHRILDQVARDRGIYPNGSSYHELNGYADAGCVVPGKLLEELNQDPLFISQNKALVELLKQFQDPNFLLSTWANFRQYLDLALFITKNKEAMLEISKFRAEGRIAEADYFEKIAFHKGGRVSMTSLVQMFRNPERFLGTDENHGYNKLHNLKKPSNYVNIPYIGLEASDIVAGLVQGKYDDLQILPPASYTYEMPGPGKITDNQIYYTPLKTLIRQVLGSRKDGITGLIPSDAVKRNLFAILQESVNLDRAGSKGSKVKFVDEFLNGTHEVSKETELRMRDAIKEKAKSCNILDSDPKIYIASIHRKSSPLAVLAGNDTACCMPFGSGKNNIYMFNPNCSQFTIQEVNITEGGQSVGGRTIAQSVLTVNIESGTAVPDLMEAMRSDSHMIDLIDESKLSDDKRYVVCDSIETNSNYRTPEYVRHLKEIYEDFFFRYFSGLPSEFSAGHNLQKDGVIISDAFRGPFGSNYEEVENTYVPLAPMAYSDNTSAKARLLTPREIENSFVIANDVPGSQDKAGAGVKSGEVSELTYQDTLHVSYLEGKIYSDNTSLIENLHNMENGLIAKDLANQIRGLPNLSFKYINGAGIMCGYLFAYEGRDSRDNQIIYVSDFAYARRSGLGAGKLLLSFIDRYADTYLNKGKAPPILLEARDSTSYRLLKRKLAYIEKRIGIKLQLEESDKHRRGSDTFTSIEIRPAI